MIFFQNGNLIMTIRLRLTPACLNRHMKVLIVIFPWRIYYVKRTDQLKRSHSLIISSHTSFNTEHQLFAKKAKETINISKTNKPHNNENSKHNNSLTQPLTGTPHTPKQTHSQDVQVIPNPPNNHQFHPHFESFLKVLNIQLCCLSVVINVKCFEMLLSSVALLIQYVSTVQSDMSQMDIGIATSNPNVTTVRVIILLLQINVLSSNLKYEFKVAKIFLMQNFNQLKREFTLLLNKITLFHIVNKWTVFIKCRKVFINC